MTAVARLSSISLTLSGTRVLDKCNLTIDAGYIHAIVGRGGCGKTLIMKTIATLLKPDEGELHLFGERVDLDNPKQLRSLRARIGIQFQNLALFDFLDVAGNVAFSIASGSDELSVEVLDRVNESLAAVGLAGIGRLRVRELSGGMQRRVAIARASVGRPELMLFDDPSGGLDPVTASKIFALISEIQAMTGCTVIVASHDLGRLLRIAHKIHFVEKGSIRFSGTIAEARSNNDPLMQSFLESAI